MRQLRPIQGENRSLVIITIEINQTHDQASRTSFILSAHCSRWAFAVSLFTIFNSGEPPSSLARPRVRFRSNLWKYLHSTVNQINKYHPREYHFPDRRDTNIHAR